MEWQIIVALTLIIPVILLPVIFVWFLNIGGIYTVIRRVRERRATLRKRKVEAEVEVKQ